MISSEGEVIVTMKDGVEYVLRFGDLRLDTSGKGKDRHGAAGRRHRRRQSQSRRQERAALPVRDGPLQRRRGQEAGARRTARRCPKAKPEAAPAEGDRHADRRRGGRSGNRRIRPPQPNPPRRARFSERANRSETRERRKPTDEIRRELEKTIAERKRIETENQRKLDEYNATLDKGRQEVKDLNLRFGDWYFVVSNDTFQKIRLGRDDVVKKKAAPGEPASAGGAASAAAPRHRAPRPAADPGRGQLTLQSRRCHFRGTGARPAASSTRLSSPKSAERTPRLAIDLPFPRPSRGAIPA